MSSILPVSSEIYLDQQDVFASVDKSLILDFKSKLEEKLKFFSDIVETYLSKTAYSGVKLRTRFNCLDVFHSIDIDEMVMDAVEINKITLSVTEDEYWIRIPILLLLGSADLLNGSRFSPIVQEFLSRDQFFHEIMAIDYTIATSPSEESTLIVTSLICHELGHMILGHLEDPSSITSEISKQREFEADQIAVTLMGSAIGLQKFFQLGCLLDPNSISSTHPTYEARLSAIS